MDNEDEIDEPDESAVAPVAESPESDGELSWGDRQLSPDRPLSPRHRKLAELFAQGKSNAEICKELDMSGSRVSVLKSNTRIRELTGQIAERIYEETVGARLKKMAEPALNNIAMILTDNTNKVKISEKADMSKWVIEKLDGKPMQKHDIGENMLSIMMDQLDALKNSGKSLDAASRNVIELTPQAQIEGQLPEKIVEIEDDALKSWIADFVSLPKG